MLTELSGLLLAPPELYDASRTDRSFDLKPLQKKHAKEIVQIYQTVFETYPFPIFDPDYIRNTMDGHIQYHGAIYNGKLVALSSAEVDRNGQNAEMTDFATLPEFRGKNLATQLLASMEKDMRNQEITTLYTIARLNSIAMNRTFLKLGYRFAGTLIKNTNIAGNLESMNVLYKHLTP
jgi:putative beta-lysine N-acetyltransferase